VLSEGAGEEVLLCRRAAEDRAELVVVRLVGEEAADAAIAVAGAASSPHLAPLIDLFDAGDDRYGLVYPRLPSGSLAEVLARRPALAPGEAVTILVSLARAVEAMHGAGFTHGALRPTGVLFDEAGTPMLVGFCASRPFAADSGRADRRALASLAAAVLARVPGTEELAAEFTQSAEGPAPKYLQERMFALAEPWPIDYPRSAAPLTIEQLLPSRAAPPETPPPAPPAGPWPSRGLAVADGAHRMLTALRTVRRRVWVPAVLTVVGLMLALLLVPTGKVPPATGVPRPAPTTAAPRATAPDRDALQGDDPLVAARALASARDSCLDSGGGACAAAVDQPGSGLLEADSSGEGPPPPTLPELEEGQGRGEAFVQRTGDAAVVEQGGVTLLLVRTEGEWRLRDVFAAETPAPLTVG
jgi:hypothetical protein